MYRHKAEPPPDDLPSGAPILRRATILAAVLVGALLLYGLARLVG